MQTEENYLLLCLAEEAAEVSQACMKILRFGKHTDHPVTRETNVYKLIEEFSQLVSVWGSLQKLDSNIQIDTEIVIDKQEALRKYMAISRALGMLK